MNMRPRGESKWYNPERDLLNVWPGALMRAAAYATDQRSTIYEWMVKAGVPKEDILSRVRAQLQVLVTVIKTGRSSKLEDILTPDLIDWPAFQAIMFAAGITMFKQFNKYYRGARLVGTHGGVQEDPVGELDEFAIMREFDLLTEKNKLVV